MFIDVTRERNPALIEAAVEMHRRGEVPANTYVIDVDTVEANARLVAASGREHGLELFQMTKQFGRNPVVAGAIADAGIDRVVAVDFEEARVLHAHGLRIGHLGHLVQVPSTDRDLAVRMGADQVTVYDVQQAAALGAVARQHDLVQPVLLRVVGPDDQHYPAQRGGIPEDDVVAVAKEVDAMPGVAVVGVTSFPCLLWNADDERVEPTPNLLTVGRAAETLRAAGFDITVVNTPSVSCVATMGLLTEHGSTQAEPGSCFTGHTPLHAASEQPERPAMIYMSEVTHRTSDAVYALGGGLYPRSKARTALVFGRNGEPVEARVELDPADAIDYHGTLRVDPTKVQVGDTVVYAFRSQAFVSHSFIAPVRGLGEGDPRLVGLYSERGWPLTDALEPAPAVR